MIKIDDILVEEAMLSQPFLCDLGRCKGACCTMAGGSGAPVLDEEVAAMEEAAPQALRNIEARVRSEVERHGFLEGTTGGYSTRCIDDRDCVFVYYEGAVAKCSLEKAYNEGQTSFRKPLSCHLFPIRIIDFGNEYLHFEQIPECAPAREHGVRHDVKIFQMVKDGLQRRYGQKWYSRLKSLAERRESVTQP